MTVSRRHPGRHRRFLPRPAAAPHPSSPTAPSPGHTLAGSPTANLQDKRQPSDEVHRHAARSAGGRTVGQVVGDLVRYLEPRTADATALAPAVPGGDGPSSYYADRGTEPGRWLGYGAYESGLTGAVDSVDFARVLAGRDPRTGGRLITAQGSAGRRPTLGVGNETRMAADGSALYGMSDVAAALDMTAREAEELAAAGVSVASGVVAALLGGTASASTRRAASCCQSSSPTAVAGSRRRS